MDNNNCQKITARVRIKNERNARLPNNSCDSTAFIQSAESFGNRPNLDNLADENTRVYLAVSTWNAAVAENAPPS